MSKATDAAWTEVRTAADITPEIREILESAAVGFQGDESAHDSIDRADGSRLGDGSRLDMGGDLDSPGYRAALRIVRKARRDNA